MKMASLAKKSSGMEVGAPSAKEEYFPEVTITEASLPGLKGNFVGDTIKMEVEVEVCGISQYGNNDIDYRLKIKKAGMEKDAENANS